MPLTGRIQILPNSSLLIRHVLDGWGNAPRPPEGAQGLLLGHARACIQLPRGAHHLKKWPVPVPWEQFLTLLSVTLHPCPGALWALLCSGR